MAKSGTFKKIIIAVVALLIIGCAGYFWVCSWEYSTGTRSGYLMKISEKGVMFKTYEGQLNLGGVRVGEADAITQNNFWDFSVSDEAVYAELEKHQGKYITLRYHQIYKNFPWQGDTEYYIEEVVEIQGDK